MTPFEEELKKALVRCDPPEGFEERLFKKIARGGNHRVPFYRSMSNWRLVAASAVLVVAGGWGLAYRQHVREERGEAVKRQLLVAMRIAGTELREAQSRVKRLQFPEVVMQ